MPLVTLTLAKIAAVAIVKKAGAATKIKMSASALKTAAGGIKAQYHAASTAHSIIGGMIGNRLANAWFGDDYDQHRQENERLMQHLEDMAECLRAINEYLELAADRAETDQAYARQRASELPTAR